MLIIPILLSVTAAENFAEAMENQGLWGIAPSYKQCNYFILASLGESYRKGF